MQKNMVLYLRWKRMSKNFDDEGFIEESKKNAEKVKEEILKYFANEVDMKGQDEKRTHT